MPTYDEVMKRVSQPLPGEQALAANMGYPLNPIEFPCPHCGKEIWVRPSLTRVDLQMTWGIKRKDAKAISRPLVAG